MTATDPITTCLTCGEQFGYRSPNSPQPNFTPPRSCYECRSSPDDLGRVQTTCIEHAYGTTERLSFQIKVF